jgi:hypothetical protein
MATDLVRSNYIASLSRRNSPLSYAQSRNLISQILADIFLAGGSGGGGGGGGGDASAANQLVANNILDAIETAVSGAATEDTLEALSNKIAPPGQILIDRLPPQLGVRGSANALSTFDASPAFQILSTPHELGAVFPAGIAATQQQVRIIDLNSLAHRGEISIGVVVTGNPTSPGAGTLNLRWAYSSDTTGTPDSAWANTFVSGLVESISVDILAIPNQIRRGVVRSIPVARYLALWLDVPARAAGAQLTVVTRVVGT